MGAWGPKLYQDDIAEDVRDYYKDQLHRGKTGEQITDELIRDNSESLSDYDDAPIFWFALADTQWNLGRLEERVKTKALYYIELGTDLERWKNEDPKGASIRERTIFELKKKLSSEQPPQKKISQYRLYKCEWKMGDVFAYKLTSDVAKERGFGDKYVFFIKVGERMWWPGHVIPQVYFYNIVSNKVLELDTIKQYGFAHQFYYPAVYTIHPEAKHSYLLSLITTSGRVVPKKNLFYVGNTEVSRIANEDLDAYSVEWKRFEGYITNILIQWSTPFLSC